MVSEKYQKRKDESDASHKFKRLSQMGCLERIQNACSQDAVEFRRAVEECIPPLQDNGRCVIPRRSEFWTFYHNNRDALRHARLFVFKQGGDWILNAKPLYDPDSRKKQVLERDLQRWRPHLRGCCVGFIEMQIFEKVQSNRVKRYLLWCPKCQKAISSALPYSVVEHLLKDVLLELLTEADNLDGQVGGSPA